MGLDKRRVWRGKCKKCDCPEFSEKNVKCKCGHVPTAHEIGEDGGVAGGHDRESCVTTDKHQAGYGDQSHTSSQDSCYCITCRRIYPKEVGICPYCTQEQCRNPSCKRFRFTDPIYGQFDYCSPGCRDNDLLPKYNEKLERYLNEGYSSYSRSNFLSPGGSNDTVLPLSSTRSTPSITRPAIKTTNSTTYAAAAASQSSEHGIKPSPQLTSNNTLTFYSSSTCRQGSLPKSNAPTIRGGTASFQQESYLGQCTRTEIPDLDNTHLFKNIWTEDNRIGLLVTGIRVGKATKWQWLDLITGSVSPYRKFDTKMNYNDMIGTIEKAALLEIWRSKDLKCISDQIKTKVKNDDNMITFIIPHQTGSQEYGLSQYDDDRLVLLKVTPGSVADQCGIQDNDILQFFKVVHTTQPETFTLNDVKEENTGTVEKACKHLKSSPNSVGLVLVVKRTDSKHCKA